MDTYNPVSVSENAVDAFSQNLYNEKIQQIREKVAGVIIGQEFATDLILTALLANGHVLVEGVPGVAKTLTARLIAKLVDAEFSRIQFTSDIMPSDVLGTNVYNMGTSQFEFHRGPAFGDIILVDEINRAPAKTQSALFEVMEERQATIDGTCYKMGDIYTIVATQNPIEQEGTYRLPEAQMDRFMFKVVVDYPSLEGEIKVLQAHNQSQGFARLDNIEPIVSKSDLMELRRLASQTLINENMMRYIATIVQKTRSHNAIYVGASPRASIALLQASKAFALLHGRSYVVPDDVKLLAVPVLQHRISLTAEAEMDGVTVQKVIGDVVNSVEVPK